MNAKKSLDKSVQKALKGKSIGINYADNSSKYSKVKFFKVYKGYDFLGNISVVRSYVQKKNDITWGTLEILLKLMEYKFFSLSMFLHIPRNFSNARWETFLKKGFVNLVMNHNESKEKIYCLNTRGRNIVISFYEYLSGEKKIPEDSVHNPMANEETQVPFDKKKLDMIKRLNKLKPAKHIKYLFEG